MNLYPTADSVSSGGWTDDSTVLGMGSGGWSAAGTVASTAISVWSQLALADQQQMQADIVNYNNSMRAVVQGVKQYAADKNRIALGDANTNEQMQIELDRMRAESKLTVQAAFIGASGSAKKAAMFDVNRNALQAKFNQDAKYENALQQVQLSEYSDEIQNIQATQRTPADNSPGVLATITGAAGQLVDKSMKSGAWDKGSPLRTGFADLFNNSNATLPT